MHPSRSSYCNNGTRRWLFADELSCYGRGERQTRMSGKGKRSFLIFYCLLALLACKAFPKTAHPLLSGSCRRPGASYRGVCVDSPLGGDWRGAENGNSYRARACWFGEHEWRWHRDWRRRPAVSKLDHGVYLYYYDLLPDRHTQAASPGTRHLNHSCVLSLKYS